MLDLKDKIQFASKAVQNAKGRSELRPPLARRRREDISDPTFEDLLDLSLLRIRHIIEGDYSPDGPPPLLFPQAESTRATWFREADWNEVGDLETELGRLTWTLTNIPERAFPSTCRPLIKELLANNSVLAAWRGVEPLLRKRGNLTARSIVQQMLAESKNPPAHRRSRKEHFLALPIDYETGDPNSKLSLFLWHRILAEAALQALRSGKVTHTRQFLQIHAFLKDPIFGLRRDFNRQASIFHHLVRSVRQDYGTHLNVSDWRRVLAQAAMESSYLAMAQLQRVEYIHFSGHQQLPYTYVPLDSLARAEFTESAHVLELMEELLLGEWSKHDKSPQVPPILVAFVPRIHNSGDPLTVIIDGNHRVTATLLLRFIAATFEEPEQLWELTAQEALSSLKAYCQAHGLGEKWMVDMSHILELLLSPQGETYLRLLAENKDRVGEFVDMEQVPALVVQEENFHTICKQRTTPREHGPDVAWLLPMHQSVFNDDELGFGLPERDSQAHGRPLGYKAMPMRKAGQVRTWPAF